MKMTISGKQMTVRPSLKELTEKKLARFDRFFGDEAEAIQYRNTDILKG
jgi:ribosome-associated translation inhibitor RaiA